MLRLLRLNDTGEDVRAVQQGLNVWADGDGTIDETGVFDDPTNTAVRRFQDENGLELDGIVGPETRQSIFPAVVMTSGVVANVLRFPQILPDPTIPIFAPDAISAPDANLGPDPISGPTPVGFGSQAIGSGGSGGDPGGSSISPSIIPQLLPSKLFQPTRFPRLINPLAAPVLSPFTPFGFTFDHCELAPGTQHTFPSSQPKKRQDSFVLTAQCIGTRGDAKDAHLELTFGTQFGVPLNATDAAGNAWTFNPFVQLTDVDRLSVSDSFHFWQGYAQAGFQGTSGGPLSPTFTFTAFPINLGLDAGKFLTFTAGAGFFLNYSLDDGKVVVGGQLTFGINIKFFSQK